MNTDFMNDVDWAGLAGKAAMAIAILVVTWIVATLVKKAIAGLTRKIPVLRKNGSNGDTLGDSLGTIFSLLIWLFGLVAILQVFELEAVLLPIQNLLNQVAAFLPNIIAAGFVFFIGAVLAKVVRELVTTAIGALPIEKWLNKADDRASAMTETPETVRTGTDHTATIARLAGTVLYALIMIVVAIAALQILGIESISRPAEQMLQTIFDAIPAIIAAALLLGIGIMIARFISGILEQLLSGLGIDRALTEVDILPAGKSAVPVITKVVQIAIVLFFAVMAANMLNFPEITAFLSEVLELGGMVLFGGAIIAVGFLVANLLAKAMGGTGTGAMVIKYATIVLFVAMGLKYMGIADSIIELGFGALVVGGAAAAALAFGLGGRDVAGRYLARMYDNADKGSSSTPTAPAGGTGAHSSRPPTDPLP